MVLNNAMNKLQEYIKKKKNVAEIVMYQPCSTLLVYGTRQPTVKQAEDYGN